MRDTASPTSPPTRRKEPSRPRRRLHLPGRRRYPVWNPRTIGIGGAVVVTLASVSVFLLGQRPVLVEMQLTLLIVAVGMFLLLAVGLYRGARVRRRDPAAPSLQKIELKNIGDRFDVSLPDASCPIDVADGDEGCLGAIVGLILSLLVLVVLVLLLWVLINLAAGVFFVLSLALSWVMYLALRQVFARSRQCQGKLGPSIGYALLYTVLYTGWLGALLIVADYFV